MDVRDIQPGILHVELPPESLATYRAIHDRGDAYAVVLTFSVGTTDSSSGNCGARPGTIPR